MDWNWNVDAIHAAGPPQIPGHELSELLGSGGMGRVYRGRDASQRPVAVKVVPAVDLTPQTEARFQREASLMSRLRHPGLLSVYSYGRTGDLCYLVCELVEGRTLLEAAQELDLQGRLDLLVQTARALGAAHAQGIVHRDLKPDNILVDGAGRVKVIDFGLSLADDTDRVTQTGQFVGTPFYAAPERLGNQTRGDAPTSDVWSLGVLAYELLCGRHPYQGAGTLSELAARMLQPLTPPRRAAPEVPAPLSQAVLGALARDPAARYPDAAAMAHALEQAGEAAWGVGAASAGWQRPPWHWLGLALVLAAAAGVGLATWVLGPAPETATPPASPSPTSSPVASSPVPSPPVAPDAELSALLAQGLRERRGGALETALSTYRRAQQRAPHDPRALMGEAWTLLRLGRMDEGNALAREVLSRDPADADALAYRGGYQAAKGDARGGEETLRHALELDPECADAYAYLAWVQDERGQTALAEETVSRALELDPQHIFARTLRASVRVRLGLSPQGAYDDAQAVLAQDPRAPLALRYRANALALMGRLEEAEADVSRALRLAPNMLEGLLLRGQIRLNREDLHGALDDLTRAIRKSGNYKAYLMRGEVRYHLQDYTGAVEDLEQGLSQAPPSELRSAGEQVLRDARQALKARQ